MMCNLSTCYFVVPGHPRLYRRRELKTIYTPPNVCLHVNKQTKEDEKAPFGPNLSNSNWRGYTNIGKEYCLSKEEILQRKLSLQFFFSAYPREFHNYEGGSSTFRTLHAQGHEAGLISPGASLGGANAK
jgi:hypothetical protein